MVLHTEGRTELTAAAGEQRRRGETEGKEGEEEGQPGRSSEAGEVSGPQTCSLDHITTHISEPQHPVPAFSLSLPLPANMASGKVLLSVICTIVRT